MQRTAHQNKQLHALLGKLNLPTDVKEDLVYQYTDGRTIKTSNMEFSECQSLINHLNTLQMNSGKPVDMSMNKENRMRRKILSICHEMNWKQENGQADIRRVNDFLLNRGVVKKELNALNSHELSKTITQFEQLLKSYYAKR